MYTPTPGDVHVNTPLTQISIAYLQNQDQFVAAQMCPVIPVTKQSDRYYVYNRGDFFRDQMQKRAPGTPAASVGYRLDNTPTYFADVWAEAKPIPDQLRGNADAVLNMDRDATEFLSQQALIRREKIFAANLFATGKWGTDMTGVPPRPAPASSSSGTIGARPHRGHSRRQARHQAGDRLPGQHAGHLRTGVAEARGPSGSGGPREVRPDQRRSRAHHPRGARGDSRNRPHPRDGLASRTRRPRVRPPSHSFIGGKNALLCNVAPNPGLLTPSAAYTFGWTGYLGAGNEGNRIKRYRWEIIASDIVEIEMAFDIKLVAHRTRVLLHQPRLRRPEDARWLIAPCRSSTLRPDSSSPRACRCSTASR